MDRLTELFADRPLTFAGPGIEINTDTRGQGTVGLEQGIVVQSRVPQAAADAVFAGAWQPRVVDAATVNIGGGFLYDGTSTHIIAAGDVAVHATALRYVYLVCELDPTYVDTYVVGGTVVATPTYAAYASLQTNSNTYAYILLCSHEAGVITRYAYFNLACKLRNKHPTDVLFEHWPAI